MTRWNPAARKANSTVLFCGLRVLPLRHARIVLAQTPDDTSILLGVISAIARRTS
jgi:hypothetical protein